MSSFMMDCHHPIRVSFVSVRLKLSLTHIHKLLQIAVLAAMQEGITVLGTITHDKLLFLKDEGHRMQVGIQGRWFH